MASSGPLSLDSSKLFKSLGSYKWRQKLIREPFWNLRHKFVPFRKLRIFAVSQNRIRDPFSKLWNTGLSIGYNIKQKLRHKPNNFEQLFQKRRFSIDVKTAAHPSKVAGGVSAPLKPVSQHVGICGIEKQRWCDILLLSPIRNTRNRFGLIL